MFQKKTSPYVLCLGLLKIAVAGKGLRFSSCSNFFSIYIFAPIRFPPKNKLTFVLELLAVAALSYHNRTSFAVSVFTNSSSQYRTTLD